MCNSGRNYWGSVPVEERTPSQKLESWIPVPAQLQVSWVSLGTTFLCQDPLIPFRQPGQIPCTRPPLLRTIPPVPQEAEVASSGMLLALLPAHTATKAAQLNFLLMMEPMSRGDSVAQPGCPSWDTWSLWTQNQRRGQAYVQGSRGKWLTMWPLAYPCPASCKMGQRQYLPS